MPTVLDRFIQQALLQVLPQERERRGHRFVRDADDGNIHVKSARAGQRVLASVTRVLTRRLKVTGKAAKRAVDRPWRRTFLGVTFTGRRPNRRRVRGKALQARQHAVRQRTQRTRGVSLGRVAGNLRRDLDGRYASFGFAEAPSSFKALDSWIRRWKHRERMRRLHGIPHRRHVHR
jgi:RNA-directed DNA polymerase